MRKGLVVLIVLSVALTAMGSTVYFWPVPTVEQACMGADRFCTLESPGYYSKVERYGSETNFYLSEEQTELFWMDTANFLSEKGLGPHALIAAAYILSDPEPFPETLSYPTAGGRVVITVSTVDKIEGWADLVSFTLAYFR